jgi:hypothetical protein
MARRRPRGARRSLTTAETMIALVGPNPAALVRSGLSPKQAQAIEREWLAWDRAHGHAFRVAAGITPPSDHGDELPPAGGSFSVGEPPDPPGFGLVG